MEKTHLGKTSKLQCLKLFMKPIYEIYPTMEFVPVTPKISGVFFSFIILGPIGLETKIWKPNPV